MLQTHRRSPGEGLRAARFRLCSQSVKPQVVSASKAPSPQPGASSRSRWFAESPEARCAAGLQPVGATSARAAWLGGAELLQAASGFAEEEKSGSSPKKDKVDAGESWESVFAGATGLVKAANAEIL